MPDILNDFVKIVFIVGSCRSGKTSLGQLVSSSKNTEFIDESMLLISLPILSLIGRLNEDEASLLFKMYLDELIYETVLMRKSNFRPFDQSCIWKSTSIDEVMERIALKRKIDACNYIENNKFTVVISLPDNLGAFNFVRKLYPYSKVIISIRSASSVAGLVKNKGWFSDESLVNPLNATITRNFVTNGTEYLLPWWVLLGEESKFINLTEFERGLYYWYEMNKKYLYWKNQSDDFFSVKFEDLIEKTTQVQQDIFDFVGNTYTGFTNQRVLEISQFVDLVDTSFNVKEVSNVLDKRYIVLMREIYGD